MSVKGVAMDGVGGHYVFETIGKRKWRLQVVDYL